MRHEHLNLRFEKILERAVSDLGLRSIEFIGTDSSLAIALFLSEQQAPEFLKNPRLVIVPTAKEASAFAEHLRFFDASFPVAVLPGFDVSPYSGLYPSARAMSARVRWCFEAQNPDFRQVFVAPVTALMQRTMPREILKAHTQIYRRGAELPSEVAREWSRLGYQSVPVVEDVGTFAVRGGIVDVYSPAHRWPVRIELFGDTIESMRFFNPESQRSEKMIESFTLIPPREVLFDDESRMRASQRYRESVRARDIDTAERESILQSLTQGQLFPGIDFLLGDFYQDLELPTAHFRRASVWLLNPHEVARESDNLLATLKKDFAAAGHHAIRPAIEDLFLPFEKLSHDFASSQLHFSKIFVDDRPGEGQPERFSLSVQDIRLAPAAATTGGLDAFQSLAAKVAGWRREGFAVFIAAASQAQTQRLCSLFEGAEMRAIGVAEDAYDFADWLSAQQSQAELVHVIPRAIEESVRLNDERILFLRDEDFFGKKQRRRDYKQSGTLTERTHSLSFGDLKPGDAVVHVLHGIGIYEGLKVMQISGFDAEFIALSYKDGDKLYLPVYRVGQIQKYAGPVAASLIDKLGGTQWRKVTAKVRNHLREIAADLLKLYAKRSQIHRPPFPSNDDEFYKFEAAFPYDETDDQLKAVGDIVSDMTSDKPMDRLVCGDVGFGKTEVAMRAAFKALEGRRQVAVLAPTTVLTFQHLETFQRRFASWPITVRALNRFVPAAESKKTLDELSQGKVDVVIGTHRLLSKDIRFKDLGLLIIDEEQRFGVTHKEKIRALKANVDTLTLSATPIPRTLNMSLVGMRDLSIINTPPVDRLPTRTFVTKFDRETISKAIEAEIQRGGQVFFLHNRVQSIYSLADELRELVPTARMRVGHGQMDEHELEQVMVAFYKHQIDVLVCTTIIEAGIDNPRANTMFIDNAHQFGLSQLYQLRGRVGRSKERAYCYLLIPPNRKLEADAQERLKIIQENTELGSGIRIAHHDLELRGAGNLLGEDQSGHIDAVGYEMYLELLEDAIKEVKGKEPDDKIEPDINVRIPALIPDSYIPDIRVRLSYYKALADIASPDDIDRIEDELRDQFGKIPDQVLNLMGLMLIRHHCRELGVRDLSSGAKSVSLAFTEKTPLPPARVVELAQKQPGKYNLTPDMRLIVRLPTIAWPPIYDELLFLKSLSDPALKIGLAK